MTCDDAYDSDGRPINDAEYFAVIRGAMKVLNFTEEEQWNIWTIVALVMHLGNVVFGGEEGRGGEREEPERKEKEGRREKGRRGRGEGGKEGREGGERIRCNIKNV